MSVLGYVLLAVLIAEILWVSKQNIVIAPKTNLPSPVRMVLSDEDTEFLRLYGHDV